MSKKARDGQGRWRSKTIAFRISPEENVLLEDFVRLSSLTKQQYLIQRVLNREVVVCGNPRVHRALRAKMAELCEEIKSLPDVACISPESMEALRMIAVIYADMKCEV